MCGVVAIFAYSSTAPQVDREELLRIRDHMALRGPDSSGEWFTFNQRVGLGHRRLSIIDLSSNGHQPMLNDGGTLAITFNGEIYNYRGLRSDLEKKGYRFRSQSDTEVLLHLYAEEGESMLDKLRGMYAFAIWDEEKHKLFLARDPFGIKPLYYSDDGKSIRVASQVKALLSGGRIDTSPEAAGHVGYFLWGHVPDPYTLYKGIRALPAGCSLRITENGASQPKAFCSIPEIMAQAGTRTCAINHETLHERLRRTLVDSVKHHLIADVPVGVFLSAGLDSATLSALAAELGGDLRTVTLAFQEFKGTEDDETPLAEEIASRYGTRHQTIQVTRKDFQEDLPRLLDAMDQPTSDGVNSFFISKAAREAGLKVALSGLGGDELFGSYPSFSQVPPLVDAIRHLRFFPNVTRSFRIMSTPLFKRYFSPKHASVFEYGSTYGGAYLLRRGMFMPWELPDILDGDVVREGLNQLQTIQRLDDTARNIDSPHWKVSALEMNWYMRHQLLRDSDWAGMGHSLEIRVPLVDVKVLTEVGPLFPGAEKPDKREMARTPSRPLPEAVINRRKTGFSVPVRQWLLEQAGLPGRDRSSTDRGLRLWCKEVYRHFGDGSMMLTHARRSLPSSSNPLRQTPVPSKKVPVGHVLVLLTDAFGGFGGISKFNQDLLNGLSSCAWLDEITAIPRLMPNDPGPLPEKLRYATQALGGKLNYSRTVLAETRGFKRAPRLQTQLIICAHINLLPTAFIAKKLLNVPIVLIIHGIDAWQPTPSRLANSLAKRVDYLISVSQLTRDRFAGWSGVDPGRSFILPDCVNLSDFGPGPKPIDLLNRYGLQGKKVLLTVGRLASAERYKGFDETLEVLPKLAGIVPEIAYLIAGDGPDRARLEQKARDLGIAERVTFAGRISDGEKPAHYRLADTYVMPSSGEGFGIVLLEALASGIPVIASKIDGGREALRGGELGMLVDPRDHGEIVAAILASLRQSAGSVQPGLEHFSSENFQKRCQDIFSGLRPVPHLMSGISHLTKPKVHTKFR